jgi:hypothetical protein
LNGEKRKRASSMDILIESSLFLSMANPKISNNYIQNNNNNDENNDMNINDSLKNNNKNNSNKQITSIESGSGNETESDETDGDLNSIKNSFTPINPLNSGPFRVNSPAKSIDSKITDSDNDASSFECIGAYLHTFVCLH